MKRTQAPKPPRVDGARGIAEWTGTILIYLFAATALVQGYVIPTGSMDGTLMVGDHVFVDKVTFSPPGPVSKYLLPYREPRHGDIIVFRYPPNIVETYVKRVIGVSGDRIRIENKRVFRNGVASDEPYTNFRSPSIEYFRDNFPAAGMEPPTSVTERGRRMLAEQVRDGELVVPPGYYFAMGDNRDDSFDSRYWGLVPRENNIGTPVLIYWSYDAETKDLLETNVRHVVDVAVNFFRKTRWNRAFRVVRNYSE